MGEIHGVHVKGQKVKITTYQPNNGNQKFFQINYEDIITTPISFEISKRGLLSTVLGINKGSITDFDNELSISILDPEKVREFLSTEPI